MYNRATALGAQLLARFFYTILFHLLLPAVCLRLWWRGRKAPAYRERWRERFGLGGLRLESCIWVHAVSVGETLAAQPLVNALLRQYPDTPLLVTTMTPTGSERVRAIWGTKVAHVYAPYDLPWALRAFLRRMRPRLLVIMETELWPNMLAEARAAGVPTLLANARLSERSARGYARVGALSRGLLRNLSAIAAQDPATAQRFIGLGYPAAQISVSGSIKFDITPPAELAGQAAVLREQWALGARPVLVAASTHAGEDEPVLAAFRAIREAQPSALLILVPRHPERFLEVARLLAREGWVFSRRSAGEAVGPETAVLLGDSMGELLLWFALGHVAFVGGSLVPVGGHNMLEPIALGLPALSGPAVFNFQSIADELVAEGALTLVPDAPGLAAAVLQLLDDPAAWARQRDQGLAVVARNRGALARQLALIARLLEPA